MLLSTASMRISLVSLLLLALSPLISAQQAVNPDDPITVRTFNALKAHFIGGRMPVDVAKRQAEDDEAGVIRLTDSNYHDLILNGNADDLWVIMVHGDQNPRSVPQYLEAHTEAVKLAKESSHPVLKHVKWARLDYGEEWKTCARWFVFRPPYLILATKNGLDLKFFSPKQFPPKGEVILEFIEGEQWRQLPPWSSSFAPGMPNSFIPEAYVKAHEWWSSHVPPIPAFMWMLGTGAVAKWIMNFFHSPPSGAATTTKTTTTTTTEPKKNAAPVSNAKTRSAAVEKALKQLREEREAKAKADAAK